MTFFIDKNKKKFKSWKKEDWDNFKHESEEIHKALVAAINKNLKPSSEEVQELIGKHYAWIKHII